MKVTYLVPVRMKREDSILNKKNNLNCFRAEELLKKHQYQVECKEENRLRLIALASMSENARGLNKFTFRSFEHIVMSFYIYLIFNNYLCPLKERSSGLVSHSKIINNILQRSKISTFCVA
jgi:hypothetical protein